MGTHPIPVKYAHSYTLRHPSISWPMFKSDRHLPAWQKLQVIWLSKEAARFSKKGSWSNSPETMSSPKKTLRAPSRQNINLAKAYPISCLVDKKMPQSHSPPLCSPFKCIGLVGVHCFHRAQTSTKPFWLPTPPGRAPNKSRDSFLSGWQLELALHRVWQVTETRGCLIESLNHTLSNSDEASLGVGLDDL